MTLLHAPLSAAAASPALKDRVALVANDREHTYGDVWDGARHAIGWCTRETRAGERVAVMLPNGPELVAIAYGVPAAGRILTMVPAQSSARTARFILADSGAAAFVTTPAEAARLELPADTRVLPPGDVLAAAPAEPPAAVAGDPAAILYTTGTSGVQKGALLSHRALTAATANVVEFMRLDDRMVEAIATPLTHSFGFGRLRAVLAAGGQAVLENGLTQAGRLFQTMQARGVDSLALVPAGWAFLLKYAADGLARLGDRLRFVEIGSDHMLPAHKRRLMELFPGARLCMHYGLTEASRSTFLELHSEVAHLDTVGRAAPHVRLRVAEPGSDGAGEVCVAGDTLMTGYWNQPELTRAALADGWLRTGDLGRLDGDGYLKLLGRRSEMIKVCGFSVAPAEIEQVLAGFPGVQEAAVAGLPDPSGLAGARVEALVVTEAGAALDVAALRHHCAAQLEPYKLPQSFRAVPSLPRTPSGKLERRRLPGWTGA